MRCFPDGFLFGVATSGHQTEGDNTSSDTWFLENVAPTVFAERSGRACNSWQLWRTDLDLVQAMGLGAFRFSVEWARVEPEEGSFSTETLDHYAAIVDSCSRRGLAAVVTLNHMTCPHWFAARSGSTAELNASIENCGSSRNAKVCRAPAWYGPPPLSVITALPPTGPRPTCLPRRSTA